MAYSAQNERNIQTIFLMRIHKVNVYIALGNMRGRRLSEVSWQSIP